MIDPVAETKRLAKAAGLSVRDCGNGHLQVIGGPLLVNYYPTSKKRSAYIDGTTRRLTNVDPSAAVALASKPPEGIAKKDGRDRRVSQKEKRRLMAIDPICFWCRCELTAQTATIDHRIPLNRGGLDHPKNMVLSCEPCNKRRGHDMPELQERVS